MSSEKASRRDRRGRQLRLLLRPGPVLLRRGEGERAGAGAHERRARRLSRRRRRDRLRLRHQRRQGRARRRRSDLRATEQHPEVFGRAARPASRSRRGKTLDGLGKYLREEIDGSRRARRRMSPRSSTARAPTSSSPTSRSARSKRRSIYAEQALEAGCAFVNCIPVFIASDPNWRRRFEERRAADRRRRHQEPGRRDDRAPGARQPFPRARRAARPHLPAQLRRQHRLPEHARARAARIRRRSRRRRP